MFIGEAQGYYTADLTPEVVADNWATITDRDGYVVPANSARRPPCTPPRSPESAKLLRDAGAARARRRSPSGGEAQQDRHAGHPRRLVVVAVIFIVQNSDKATIRFLFISVTTRIWVGFLIALALGVVLDRLFSMWWRRRQQ